MTEDRTFDLEAEWRKLAEDDPVAHSYEGLTDGCFYCKAYGYRPTRHPDTCAWVLARRHFGLPDEFDGEAYEVYDHRLDVSWRIRQLFTRELGYGNDHNHVDLTLVECEEIEDPVRGPAFRFRTRGGDDVFITKAAHEELMS